MIVLTVDSLRKHFGPEPVLDGVTFEVRPGGADRPGRSQRHRQDHAAEDPRRQGRGRRRHARFHPSVHLGYLEQQPEFEPGRTLLRRSPQRPGRPRRSCSRKPIEAAPSHRRNRRSRSSTSAWPTATTTSSTSCSARRLQPRPPHRARARRPALPPRVVPPARRARSAAASRTG